MTNRRGERGLTLIEILLSLIVMVVGIIGILAIFPPALQSSKESVEDTTAAMLAESVANSICNAFFFPRQEPGPPAETTVSLTHDLLQGATSTIYSFKLPRLPTSAADWQHHPGGGKAVNPETDPYFDLGGDAWINNSVEKVRSVNDPTEPYKQFAFSFDVRKINILEHLLGTQVPGAAGGVVYQVSDLEPLVKLYEFRIHVFRKAVQGSSSSTGGGTSVEPGPGSANVNLQWIHTFVKRVTIK